MDTEGNLQPVTDATPSCRDSSLAMPYRPSSFLLGAIIFMTALSTMFEIFDLTPMIIYSLTTYAPTIHFAVQGIICNVYGSSLSDSNSIKAARRAVLLTCIWVLAMCAHILFWWNSRKGAFAVLFLLPTLPGIQTTLYFLGIATRFTLDARTIQEEIAIRPSQLDEEQRVANELAFPASQSSSGPPGQIPLNANFTPGKSTISPRPARYEPPLPLLALSILLSVGTIVAELKVFQKGFMNSESFLVFSALVYIPTMVFHLYLIARIMRGLEDTFTDTAKIGGFSFELTALWLGSYLVEVSALDLREDVAWIGASIISSAETMLIVYLAVKYTRSVLQEWKWIREVHAEYPSLAVPLNYSGGAHPETSQIDEMPSTDAGSTSYNPSALLLVIYNALSVACAVLETRAEPVCGALMTTLVYIPTVVVSTSWLAQKHHGSDPASASGAKERAIRLCVLWLMTQAFYMFGWPINGYFKPNVTQPWIRLPAVGVSVYIARRYVRDRHSKSNIEGVIRLPPDSNVGPSESEAQAPVGA